MQSQGALKRQQERSPPEKQRDMAANPAERRKNTALRGSVAPDGDPHIAGIMLGPKPPAVA